ncbi:MAG: S-adenosylmethionine:tRNA ribosyltransferase-isomerase [Duncaniella sp.]|nr:S-adenosylmethionine:tRNA ribosyltransferase-isomerase [Duncaniella sp.]
MTLHPEEISIEEYDYALPQQRIALHPLQERDSCKLLFRDSNGAVSDHIFSEIADLLPSRSLLVYNNTKVINARLRFRKGMAHDGALIEIFCLEPVTPADYAENFASSGPVSWKCFVGNSKKWKEGELTMEVKTGSSEITLSALRTCKEGNAFIIEFSWDDNTVSFSEIIAAAGEIPIPPYLNRSTEDSDSSDYQTVYSHIEGSVAAPTAGLHFTPELLDKCRRNGIDTREVTLHVGAGTFQPVKTETIGDHEMHSEFIAVGRELISELADTDRPVIAVGTTSVRTLESLYRLGCYLSRYPDVKDIPELPQWYSYSESQPHMSRKEAMKVLIDYLDSRAMTTFVATTRLIIAPGYNYMVVDGMITNFHQPRSTLLLLVGAMIGDSWHDIYSHALASDYRFLSYGDACLFLKSADDAL